MKVSAPKNPKGWRMVLFSPPKIRGGGGGALVFSPLPKCCRGRELSPPPPTQRWGFLNPQTTGFPPKTVAFLTSWQVMAAEPSHWAWLRERPPPHSGAIRPYSGVPTCLRCACPPARAQEEEEDGAARARDSFILRPRRRRSTALLPDCPKTR